MTDYIRDWSYGIYLAYLVEEKGGDPLEVIMSETDKNLLLIQHRGDELREIDPNFRPSKNEAAWMEHARKNNEDNFFVTILFHCIFAKLLMKTNTLLVSSSGETIQPDDYVFVHEDRLDWVYPRWPLRSNTELKTFIEYFDNGTFDGGDLAERYCFLDFPMGVLAMKNNSRAGFNRSSHFSDDAFCERYVAAHVSPFISRAVVWNDAGLPDSFAEFLENIGAIEERWGLSALLSKTGQSTGPKQRRGTKPTGARLEFLRRYPNGKPEGLSGDAIAAELTEAGFPISGRMVNKYAEELKN
ncbi:hypothetical protein [Ruegeria lacuscaerulensis]|uniref:hypothetical protein n=1 Tax=Ruegeria lacuscaerulensis TaxID=55218 RepID=UPI00147F6915|nr:hypothetical protein [Ruegeria lacuscaerulensis]